MSPDLTFPLMLALRMAVAAAFVVTASIITERSGPVIGALIATLPISAGPSYVFLALDHDAAFIAEGALASLAINAATMFLSLIYVVLAQRQNALVSIAGAMAPLTSGPTQPDSVTTIATSVATIPARNGISYQRRVISGILTCW